MPTRIKVLIAVVGAAAGLVLIVPLILGAVHGVSRPQVVVTIPVAAAHSPLPYATPFPAVPHAPDRSGSSINSQQLASTQGSFGEPPTIVKLKKPGDGMVDINAASQTDLQRLPGIGPAMSARIVKARTELGGFRKATDLLEVRGIGPKKFNRMAPFISVK